MEHYGGSDESMDGELSLTDKKDGCRSKEIVKDNKTALKENLCKGLTVLLHSQLFS